MSEGGEVYTSRRLSLGKDRAVEGVVYAQDLHTKQVWKAKVHLLAKSPQVKKITNGGLHFFSRLHKSPEYF